MKTRNEKISSVWEAMDEAPQWVSNAHAKWKARTNKSLQNRTKYFKGSSFVYRVEHGAASQGSAPIIGLHKKSRYLDLTV